MSEMQRRGRLRASDEERDYVLHILQQAHAAGRLGIEELNDRQDKALTTKYSDEFVELLEDLPEGREVVASLRTQAPGVGIDALLARARDGWVAAVDPSWAMIRAARRRHRDAIAAGRVTLARTDAARLPWPDATFDGATAVNSVML